MSTAMAGREVPPAIETGPGAIAPVFVVGKQGSGTTGLANHLCAHPRIAGILHERHNGIHESAFFSHVYGRYGDPGIESNYREMVEVLAASDYFRLAGATREYLYSLWPIGYAELFRAVMDRYAEMRGARYWVEKTPTHTLYIDRMARLYPDARFVGIRRDVGEVVASIFRRRRHPAVTAGGGRRLAYAARTAASWGYYNRILRRGCARSGRGLIVDYARFRDDRESALRDICSFLDLPFDPRMLENPFPPNTSFRHEGERSRELSHAELGLVKMVGALAERLAPGFLVKLDLARRDRRSKPLPGWFFRLQEDPLGTRDPGGRGAPSRTAAFER